MDMRHPNPPCSQPRRRRQPKGLFLLARLESLRGTCLLIILENFALLRVAKGATRATNRIPTRFSLPFQPAHRSPCPPANATNTSFGNYSTSPARSPTVRRLRGTGLALPTASACPIEQQALRNHRAPFNREPHGWVYSHCTLRSSLLFVQLSALA